MVTSRECNGHFKDEADLESKAVSQATEVTEVTEVAVTPSLAFIFFNI